MRLASLQAAAREANNLTALRFVAAFAVLFTHSWPIALGGGAVDPVSAQLTAWFGPGAALGSLAVGAFFAISGYLVMGSALRRSGVGAFLLARALRIYPALLAAILACAGLGLAVTNLAPADYLASERLHRFLADNALMWNAMYRLPGVFETHPLSAVNGSLWTLPLEIRCYVGAALLLALGVLRRAWLFAPLALAVVFADGIWGGAQLLGEPAAANCIALFLIGAVARVSRRVVPASVLVSVALLLAAWALGEGAAARLLGLFGYAHLVLWIGLVAPRLAWPERALGDPSYGVYIYAFPVQQLAVHLFGPGQPWTVIAFAAPLTLALGWASWRFLEAPILIRKGALAAALARAFVPFRRRQAAAIPS